MKHLFPHPMTLALTALALALPCRADANPAQQDVPFQTITGVITEVRPAQKQVDERVADLEAQAKKEADPASRKQIEKDVEEMRRQREALREQIVAVDGANADNWNEVRDRLNTLLTDMERLIERSRARDKAG